MRDGFLEDAIRVHKDVVEMDNDGVSEIFPKDAVNKRLERGKSAGEAEGLTM